MSAFSKRTTALGRFLAIQLIVAYRNTLRHLMLPTCRFHPSCSAYAIEAISSKGFFRGSYLAAKRVIRCNPFVSGGFDPIQ